MYADDTTLYLLAASIEQLSSYSFGWGIRIIWKVGLD